VESDWSAEIGPGFPWIDATWSGFLDLRTSPHTIDSLPEPAQHPALRDALLALNAPASPLFTSRCDTWILNTDEIDPDEFSASPQAAVAAFASYIDILDRAPGRFTSFALSDQRARELTKRLRQFKINCARVDAVIRGATVKATESGTIDGYGITLYVAACGATQTATYAAWQTALKAAVAATIAVATIYTGE